MAGSAIGERLGGRLISSLDGAGRALSHAARIARFLRERRAFLSRPDDVFVVTYPRSGTTWVQYLVHSLIHPQASFEHFSDVSPWWERSLATGRFEAADYARLPPARVFKSHLRPRWLPAQGRFLYVTRDPEDVVCSYYELYRSHLGYADTFDRFLERFLAGDLQYGAWADHVAAWRGRSSDPRVELLAYEELHAAPRETARRIADFLGLSVDAGALDRALERASFSAMKAQEERFDHTGELLRDHGVRPGHFLREGRSGGGRERLDARQRARLHRSLAHSTSRGPLSPLALHRYLH